jgi:hypothetical protein
LPAGLTLAPSGLLSGTPTAPGSSTFTVQASDANGCPAQVTYTIAIAPAGCAVIAIAPPSVPDGMVGAAYSQVLSASGGAAPYTFTVVSGAVPAGLTLSAGGVLSGTPTTSGSSTVTIRATDGNGCFAQITYTIAIAPAGCAVITIAPPTVPNGTVGVAYTQTISASGGAAPYTFALITGTVPAGLALSAAGVLSGTPSTVGSSTFTVRATDANGCVAQITYTLAIIGAVPTLPQAFAVLLALGLAAIGYRRLRRRAGAE